MRYRLDFHPLVNGDLKRIAYYVAEFAGPMIGDTKVREIRDFIDTLAERPHRGTIRDEIAPNLRAFPASKKGIVLFTVDDIEKSVYVIAATYGGQDWTRIARERIEP